jgi:23S rRNA (uracil1939-C5)-methyltransferase
MSDTITVTLAGIAHGGEAIGRHANKIVFVPYAIPGETVQVEIVEEKQRWARARLLRVVNPSSDRTTPPCSYFGPGRCGGCQWQHIDYARQLALKAEVVADQLRRLGRIAQPPVLDPIALADDAGLLAFGYRNHVQFVVDQAGQLGFVREAAGRAREDDSKGDSAARADDVHASDIIPVDACLLVHPLLGELHAALVDGALAGDAGLGAELNGADSDEAASTAAPVITRRISLRAGVNTGQQLLLLETRDDRPPSLTVQDVPLRCALRPRRGPVQPLIGDPWIEELVAGRVFRISAGSFFQVNTVGAEVLVALSGELLALTGAETLLDAYCGVGLFGLSLAEQARQVIGIEESESACEDFAWNARDLDNVTLHEGPVANVLATFERDPAIDVAIIDPPRSGAGPLVVEQLQRLQIPRLLYVACDPATLARDAQLLVEAGYRLEQVQPVDLFPQTYHVESLALFQLGPAEP